MKIIHESEGNTLVEVIASVVIISIVAVMLLTGFAVVARLTQRSNEVIENKVEGEFEIESKMNSGEEDETVTVQIKDGVTVIDTINEGYYYNETNEYSDYKAIIYK